MPPQFADGTGELVFHFDGSPSGGEAISTLGYRAIDPFDTDQLDDILTAFAAGVVVHFNSSTSVTSLQSNFQVGENIVHTESTTGAGPGGNAQPVPDSVAVLVRKLTAFSGRANRGRMFLPGVSLVGLSGPNNLDATTQNNYQEGMEETLAAIQALEGFPVLHHRALLTSTDLTEVSVQSLLATQRGRLRD